MGKLTFVVFAECEELAAAIEDSLEKSGNAQVLEVVRDEESLAKSLRERSPSALFFDLGYAPHLVLDLCERIPSPRPRLIVSGPEDQSDVILRALKLGAREYLGAGPDAEQISAAVARLALEDNTAGPRERGRVIAILGAKGGVGATLVACQLGASLQRLGGRVCVIDLNVPLGDVALYFDLRPSYTLADIANAAEKADAPMVERVLQSHGCGVRILAAPARVEQAELIADRHIDAVFETLRDRFDWIVADVSRTWNDASVHALERSDQIVLVALQDVPTLNHARTYQDLLLRLGVPERKIRTIVNRHTKGDTVSDKDVASFLGAAPDAVLPNDYSSAVTCVNEGRTLADVAAGSALCTSFDGLARLAYEWTGRPAPETDDGAGLGSRLRRLMGKGKKNVTA